ncbi:MAG: hypothetical protein PHW04_04005 [Candidatus Wallbacteria bacterium]|nr:hypothetical protein [Candidatus Wallbacteria bacterium]
MKFIVLMLLILTSRLLASVYCCNYVATVGGTVGTGGSVLLADVNIAFQPAYSVSICYVTSDPENSSADTVVSSVSPSGAISLSASLGPKLEPFKIEAFDQNISAGASATVSGALNVKAGIGQTYVFSKPYTDDLKAEGVLIADKMLDWTGAGLVKPVISSIIAKLTDVDLKNYLTATSVSLGGSLNLSGGINGQLGLTDDSNSPSIAGVSGSALNISGTMNMGIAGGIMNGKTMLNDMTGASQDKYWVSLTGGLSGEFSVLKLSALLGQISFTPSFQPDESGSLDLSLVFRFDANMKAKGASLIITPGFKLHDNLNHPFIKALIEEAKKTGAAEGDYAELMNVLAVKQTYVFLLDLKLCREFFGEALSFSESLLHQANLQNGDTVNTKVKGMFGMVQNAMKKISGKKVPYSLWTELRLSEFNPNLSLNVSLGINLNLGVSTSFLKTKSFMQDSGNLRDFKLNLEQHYDYTRELARFNRNPKVIINKLLELIKEEVLNSKAYVYSREDDGSLMIVQLEQNDSVNLIYISPDGQTSLETKKGEEATNLWKKVRQSVGRESQYLYQNGPEVIDLVGKSLEGILQK